MFTGDSRERDWTFYITPDDKQLTDVSMLTQNVVNVRQMWVPVIGVDKYLNPKKWDKDGDAYQIEAEVTPPPGYLRSPLNPFPCARATVCRVARVPLWHPFGRTQSLLMPKNRLCAYGPWVQEAVHNFHPEIHPAEAVYWQSTDSTWELLMFQDASGRFDGHKPQNWITVRGDTTTPQDTARAEHWVQQAMIGEFVVPFVARGAPPRVFILEEQGIERIGTSDSLSIFPPSNVPAGILVLPVARSPIGSTSAVDGDTGEANLVQAVVVERPSEQRSLLVIRAQIRGAKGASRADLFENRGAYAHVRVVLPTR